MLFDALMGWLFRRNVEIVDSSQVKTAFFRLTREEPYWELDSFVDQAGRLVEVYPSFSTKSLPHARSDVGR